MTDPHWDSYVKTSAALNELLAEIKRLTGERDQAVADLERCRHELAVLKAAVPVPPQPVDGTHPGAERQPAHSPGVPFTNPE